MPDLVDPLLHATGELAIELGYAGADRGESWIGHRQSDPTSQLERNFEIAAAAHGHCVLQRRPVVAGLDSGRPRSARSEREGQTIRISEVDQQIADLQGHCRGLSRVRCFRPGPFFLPRSHTACAFVGRAHTNVVCGSA